MLDSKTSLVAPTPAATCDDAMQLQIAGRLDAAEQLYRSILKIEPDHAVANHCLGMLMVQSRRPAAGLGHLLAALTEHPEEQAYWLGYLEALLQADRVDDAVAAAALGEQHGLAGPALKDFKLRLAAQVTLLEQREDERLLGLVEQRRFDEARAQAAAMTERFPLHGLGWKILGAMLWVAGNSEGALAAMRTSARLMPTDAETHSNLGMILAKSAQFEEAAVFLDKAIEIDPTFAAARYRQGMSYELQGRYAEAEASLRSAIALRSGSLTVDDVQGYSNLLYVLSYNPLVDADALFNEHRRVGEEFEADLRAHWPRHRNNPDPDRRLQVGLVSGDLRNHAVATFLEPVLAHLYLDENLELHAYSNCATEDTVTARLRGYVKHWNPVVNLADAVVAQKIIDDGIDILIDLSGHTGMNRLRTFAYKPAPIQASWIGYPCTTGLRCIDYYFADRHWLPPDQFGKHFTEKLVYLAAGAPFQPHASSPTVNPLPALATGSLTFGSFNRMSKITPAAVRLWSALLRALPETHMILAGMPTDGGQGQLIEQFAANGIARERLTFHARRGMDEYLALHHQIDICLDTHPYTGGTTTYHALWMGVPTLTVAGSTSAARQGAAIMGQVGLDGFTATDDADFLGKGIYWANHLVALADMRARLREQCRQSPVLQPHLIVDALGRALRRMWQHWCAGLPPESFEIISPESVR